MQKAKSYRRKGRAEHRLRVTNLTDAIDLLTEAGWLLPLYRLREVELAEVLALSTQVKKLLIRISNRRAARFN